MGQSEERNNKEQGEDVSPPTASFADSAHLPSGQVGPYKLLSTLGEGGFAVVYLAEQQKPVKRRVALKVIKPGMDSKQVIARFEAERQALALLDHPNIAQVYDAGTTEIGRPYFVMEHVKGVSLTRHCDREKLNVEERLELFMQVCEAVQYAHQKGIIHRDIKSSNILVSMEGEKAIPKVIDFGVAKAITQPLTEQTLFTEQGQLIGTPEYMSPEQAEMAAQDIDTRSDIYSLGVLLYELLTGTLPFDRKTLEHAGFAEIQRIIREEEPPLPSTRLTSMGEEAKSIAKSRRTEVASLAKRLHKELEWIPLKAMRKERAYRYRSVSEFADDIRNYLNGDPLIAGPESMIYRSIKFVRRKRALVTGIATVTVVLMAGIIVSTIFAIGQRRAREKAEQQTKILEAVNDFLNNDLLASVDPARAKGRQITVLEVLDAASKNLEGKFDDAPLIEASIRETLGTMYRKLGKYEEAELHLEHARLLRRRELGEENPETLLSTYDLAWIYLRLKAYKEAEPLFVKTLELRCKVLGREHPDTLHSMIGLGALYYMQENYEEAEALLADALKLGRCALGDEHPCTLRSMNSLAGVYVMQGHYKEAEPLLVKGLETKRRLLGDEHPETMVFMHNLASLYLRQDRFDEAEPLFDKTLENRRRVLGEEHLETLASMHDLSSLYLKQGRYDEAEPLLEKTVEIRRRVLGEKHPETINSMYSLSSLYLKQGRYDKAEPLYVKILETRLRVPGKEHPQMMYSIKSVPQLYNKRAHYDKTKLALNQALGDPWRVLGEEQPDKMACIKSLIELYEAWNRPEKADEWRKKLSQSEGKEEQ